MFTFRPKTHTVILVLAVIGILLTYPLLFPSRHHVAAEESDLALAVDEYPAISGSALDSCLLCHTTDVGQNPPLNPYGDDYEDAGRNQAAFALIEALDSDDDSYSNIVEIAALSLPGDASSTPPAITPTNTPAPPSPTPTNTPVPPSPTPTNTPVPPSPTPTNTPVPPSPTPTNTPLPPSPTPTSTPLPPSPTPTSTPVPPTTTPTGTPTIWPHDSLYLPLVLRP